MTSTGAVSSTGPLVAGTYRASGTMFDTEGTAGLWSVTLTVTPGALVSSPTSATTTAGTAFGGQLSTSGGVGAGTYVTTAPSPVLTVSPTGAISAPGLDGGTYSVSGTTSDAFGSTGTWSFDLTVTLTASGSGSATTSGSFADQLSSVGATGAVTYSQTSGQPSLAVTPTGVVTSPVPRAVGTHTATGTMTDSAGNAGTWSYTLTVTPTAIVTTPTSAVTAPGAGYAGQLSSTGGAGAVTYVQVTGSPALTVSSTGAVTAPGSLGGGAYSASGTTSDAFGNTGSWSFTLMVGLEASGSGSTSTMTSVAGQLATPGAVGAVSYAQATGSPAIVVSSSGAVSSAVPLAAGSYVASGTMTDSTGNTGTWSYSLTVTGTVLTSSPSSGTTPGGRPFAGQLATTGGSGAVTYTQTSGSPAIVVSGSGAVSAPGSLAIGTYTASGSTSDVFGNSGTWSFSLKVTESPTVLSVSPVVVRLSPLQITVGTASATLTANGVAVVGQPVVFSANGVVCTGVTNGNGVASCTPPIDAVLRMILAGGVTATFAGSPTHLGSTGRAGLIT